MKTTNTKSPTVLKSLAAVFLMLCCTGLFAQRISKAEQVVKMAHSELDQGMEKGGDIHVFAKENSITGTIELEYVLGDNKKVLTLNLLSSENMSIPHKNAIKSFLFYRKFSFKTLKKSRHEFKYLFKF